MSTTDCAEGQRCVLSTDDDTGMCVPACSSSQSCAVDTPVCDTQQLVCRACLTGEDAPCLLRDPQHPRCGGGRCVQCVSPGADSAQATECQGQTQGVLGVTPVCDKAQNTCRACQRHSECDSGVCAKDGSGASYGVPQGSCVPVEQVLVVDQDLCVADGPVFCTVQQALNKIDAQHRYVVLRKSAVADDFTDLQIGDLPNQQGYPLQIIGPLADDSPVNASSPPLASLGGVAGMDALTVSGSNVVVVVEGVAIRGSKTGLSCLGGAQVRLVRSFLAGNDTAITAASGCSLTVEQTWFGRGPDSSVFQGAPKNARSIDVTASDFWIINSVFADNGDSRQDGFGGVWVHSLSVGMTTHSGIINSTFMQQSGLVKQGKYYTTILCDALVAARLVVMNTLLFTDAPLMVSPEEHYIDPTCGASMHHNASNDTTLTDDKSLVLPMTATPFVSAATRNLHLGPDIAVGALSLYSDGLMTLDLQPDRILAPAVDLDGKSRGAQTGTTSIGAYLPAP